MSLYVMCSLVICLVSTFLVVHPKYEDGLMGRISLICIAGSCAVVLGEYVDGVAYEVNPTTLGVQFGLAIFFLRHVYRFSKWVKHGSYDWRKNETTRNKSDVVCPLLTSAGSKAKPRRKRNPDVLKAGSGQV
jgi:hypothetical protein